MRDGKRTGTNLRGQWGKGAGDGQRELEAVEGRPWLERNECPQEGKHMRVCSSGEWTGPKPDSAARLSTGISSEGGDRRAAIGAGAKLVRAWREPAGRGRKRLLGHGRQSGCIGSQRVNGRRGCGQGAGIAGACCWLGQDRRGARRGLFLRLGQPGCHGATMSSMAAATGRQARLCVSGKRFSERPQPKQQNQKNAYCASHRKITVYENHRAGNLFAPVGYHRGIAWFLPDKRKLL
jgi:hypothetical protein